MQVKKKGKGKGERGKRHDRIAGGGWWEVRNKRLDSHYSKTNLKTHTNLRTIVAVMMLILLVGCTRSPQVVKIGLVAPFEGENREMGYDGIYAARLAVREFNANPTKSGVKLALVALDDSGEADTAAGNGRALAADPSIIAVVGIGDERTRLATAESLTQAGISFVHTGVFPFEPTDPANYSTEFRQAYAEVTPFDEEAGELAGSVYDAFQLIIAGVEGLEQENRPITAESMAQILKSAKIKQVESDK
jgi:ABC-type branched-subunit amino acid transport system substrate-binding protein